MVFGHTCSRPFFSCYSPNGENYTVHVCRMSRQQVWTRELDVSCGTVSTILWKMADLWYWHLIVWRSVRLCVVDLPSWWMAGSDVWGAYNISKIGKMCLDSRKWLIFNFYLQAATLQGWKIALVRSYIRVPQAAGQVKLFIFLVKIIFFPYMPIIFVKQGKCLFLYISRPALLSVDNFCQQVGPRSGLTFW